jgi:FMN phosphatase YigB (HAD superfamily)
MRLGTAGAPGAKGGVRRLISTVIFDLSEVLIAGLLGIEAPLSSRLAVSPDSVLRAFAHPSREPLFCGEISEEEYLDNVLSTAGWDIPPREVKAVIRRNFHRKVAGTDEVLTALAGSATLVLLSDHAREWVEYIHEVHPFLQVFDHRSYSFDLGQTKSISSTFQMVLDTLGTKPGECLFVDDMQANVDRARLIGIRGVCFSTARALARELERRGLMAPPREAE